MGLKQLKNFYKIKEYLSQVIQDLRVCGYF